MIKLISIDPGKCKCGLVLADLHQKRVDQAVVLNTALLPQYLKTLNNVENTANYNSKSAQALNFGVYAADLAYVSSLGHVEDASPIFETMRTLSKSLEIENAIDKAIYERFQSTTTEWFQS